MTLSVGHVGINVTNLERSIAFYESVLTLVVMRRVDEGERRFAYLGDGEQITLTLWDQAGGAYCGICAGLHHLAFKAESLQDLDDAVARLRELEATIHHDGVIAHREGAMSGGVFFEDPDGTRLEIFVASGLTASAPTGDAPACGFF